MGVNLILSFQKNCIFASDMRCWVLYILLLCVGIGCTDENERAAIRMLDRAESLMPSHPQEAYACLDSIAYPELISARQNARWCMLRGRLADSLHTRLPYVHQLERALRYVNREGSVGEQAQIGLYLGRAYKEDWLREQALRTYLEALQKSLTVNDYNLAGYICSYMGDVYQFQEAYLKAKDKYLEAAAYFETAENWRSRGIAFLEASRNYVFADSLDRALHCAYQAEDILMVYGDSLDCADVYNALGNIFAIQGDKNAALSFFKKGISFDKHEVVSDYLSLADLYLQENDTAKVHYYMQQAKANLNKFQQANYYYQCYKVNKSEKQTSDALNALEKYLKEMDSALINRNKTQVLGLEEKYNHAQTEKARAHLMREKHRMQNRTVLFILLFVIVVAVYQLQLRRKRLLLAQKNNELLALKNEILSMQNHLLLKEEELRQLSVRIEEYRKTAHWDRQGKELEELYQKKRQEVELVNRQVQEQRQQLWERAPIVAKVQKLASTVIPNSRKSPLTPKDWQAIRELVDAVYPMVSVKLLEAGIKGVEKDICYLALFGLDTNQTAILFPQYAPTSISRYRQKLRHDLQINDRSLQLRDFLVNMK